MKKSRKCLSPLENHLPPDLLTEILARLPAKPLLKFRCVCKTWCSLIDSSDFITMQHKLSINKNSSNSQLLIKERGRKRNDLITVRCSDTFRKISNLGRVSYLSHLGHQWCNGLMLMRDPVENYMILWNPGIRKGLILPQCPLENPTYYLGFAPSSYDYKVLAVAIDNEHRVGCIAVYSLNDRRWRVKSDRVNIKDCGLLFINGWRTKEFSGWIMYWVKYDEYDIGVNVDHRDRLFFFDFDVEEFGFVQLPNAVKHSWVWFMFPFRESIAVFTVSLENRCIWALEKDGREDPWTLCLCVSEGLSLDTYKLLKKLSHFSDILYVQKSNQFLMVHGNFAISKMITSYNITNKKVQHFGKSILGNGRGIMSFITYVESLVLHRGFQGQNSISFP